MKTLTWFAFFTLALSIYSPSSIGNNDSSAQGPNIILLVADDQAWDGLSVAMDPDVPASRNDVADTPNLKSLAKQGMRFANAYASASASAPTQLSLQTGKSPAQMRWTKEGDTVTAQDNYPLVPPRSIQAIPVTELTIAELLQTRGYAAAHFGVWKLSGGGPGEHGYDVYGDNVFTQTAKNASADQVMGFVNLAEQAADFMQTQTANKKPFFVQLSFPFLHDVKRINKRTIDIGSRISEYESRSRTTLNGIDAAVGQVLETLDKLKLEHNTYIVYTSDNGSRGKKDVLYGSDGGLQESSIRVPLIVRGPGVAANAVHREPVISYDLFPTFAQWAGAATDLPARIEGGSIAKLLTGEQLGVVRPRPGLVFHYPHYEGLNIPQSAILFSGLKLIQYYDGSEAALYSVANDLEEMNNLAGSRGYDVAKLQDMLQNHLAEVNAELPQLNSVYNTDDVPIALTVSSIR